MRYLLPLAVLCGACGANPIAPTPASAVLVDGGSLTYAGCTLLPSGAYDCVGFSGTLTNQGPDCATQVNGTTVTYALDKRTALTTVQWTYPGTVRPHETVTYSGLHVQVAAHDGTWYRTTLYWQSVPCP